MSKEWLNKKDDFSVVDVRKATGNFLPGLLQRAGRIEVGDGLCVVQNFEPIPLYSALADLGFEHHTDPVSETEFRVYFYRVKMVEAKNPGGEELPLKPTAMVNISGIEPELANIVVNFWNLTWGREDAAIDMQTRLLLSLANGVGAGRMRQATRELIKAYSIGVGVKVFDELFSLFVWNQGVGTFASEIGPSSLFGAYQFIKKEEQKGTPRAEIVKALLERFGEKNPDVGTLYQSKQEK